MAARFPQSGSAIAYKIKDAYASKIKALYWAASADAVHVLRPGDTATTILTRTATGATFNSTDGRISGSSGNDAADHFQDYITGGYADDDDDFSFGFGVYGDVFNGKPAGSAIIISASSPADIAYPGGFAAHITSSIGLFHKDGDFLGQVPDFANLTPSLETVAARYVAADATAKSRVWINGSENTGLRSAGIPKGTPQTYGTSTRPIYFGWTYDGGAGSIVEWEFAFIGTGTLTDAELDAITADPTVLIEAAGAPAAELAGTATASATATGDLATTPAVKGVSIQLGDGTPAANLIGLSVRWWDAEAPTGAPDYESDVETTDASGWLEIDLSAVTALAIGANGYLHVFKAGATPADDIVAAGRVPVSDIA